MSEGKRISPIITGRLIHVPPYEGQAQRQKNIERSLETGESLLFIEQGRHLTAEEEQSLDAGAELHEKLTRNQHKRGY